MSLLSELRALFPDRRLTVFEARQIADRQTTMLLRRLGITDPPVPTELLAALPFLEVRAPRGLNCAGAVRWIKPRWTILVNGSEPATRQRFSLAHELKHVIDHRQRDVIYGPETNGLAAWQIERLICDYFSACLLMPRPWVKRAWVGGLQSVSALAELFDVSQEAMAIRLSQLGLVDSLSRCEGPAVAARRIAA